jgi:hypothetical protein
MTCKLPYRRDARPADGVERQACARLAAIAFDFEPTRAADGLSVIFASSTWGPLVNIEQNMRLLVFGVHQANAAPKGVGNEHSNLILGNFPIRSSGFNRDKRGLLRAMGRTPRNRTTRAPGRRARKRPERSLKSTPNNCARSSKSSAGLSIRLACRSRLRTRPKLPVGNLYSIINNQGPIAAGQCRV